MLGSRAVRILQQLLSGASLPPSRQSGFEQKYDLHPLKSTVNVWACRYLWHFTLLFTQQMKYCCCRITVYQPCMREVDDTNEILITLFIWCFWLRLNNLLTLYTVLTRGVTRHSCHDLRHIHIDVTIWYYHDFFKPNKGVFLCFLYYYLMLLIKMLNLVWVWGGGFEHRAMVAPE